MVAELFIRYLHFLSIIVVSSMLVAEHILFKAEISAATLRRLVVYDLIYYVSVFVLVGSGLILWLGVGKPAAFYNSNPIFHIKLAFVVIAAVCSQFPTFYVHRNRKSNAATFLVPRSVITALRLELSMLVLIPLCAVFMARGYGL